MSALLLGTAFIYAFALTIIGWGTVRLPAPKQSSIKLNHRFSILIPFRNEATHLPGLLEDLLRLNDGNTPFEVLLLDDGSTDASAQIVQATLEASETSMDWRLIDVKAHGIQGKKQALNLGIQQAKHPWILTTDADVRLPGPWLELFHQALSDETIQMVCGPVAQFTGSTWIEGFQWLDHLSLQAITRGLFGWNRPLLANGANLCYSKALFNEVNGFEGNIQHPSGDDLFLLENVRRVRPESISYLNDPRAAVTTYPVPSIKALVHQRVRWTGKAKYQRSAGIKLLGGLVLWTNLTILSLPLLLIVEPGLWGPALVAFALKFMTDAYVIFQSGVFFSCRPRLHRFVGASLFYPVFSVWVFLAGLGGRFRWKDRQLKHRS